MNLEGVAAHFLGLLEPIGAALRGKYVWNPFAAPICHPSFVASKYPFEKMLLQSKKTSASYSHYEIPSGKRLHNELENHHAING